MNYSAINIQGNILSSEILEKIRLEDTRFQQPKDFGFNPGDSVRDEINSAWSLALTNWQIFKQKRESLLDTDTGTSDTRQRWIIPFLHVLGFEVSTSAAEFINNKSYAVSHRAGNKDGFPVHIVGINQSLDKRADSGGARLSPHALIQEYLNNTEHLYGITTNGALLRVLRDATRLTRLSYVEFNLEQMMEEGLFAEFALLYRTLHASRFASQKEENASCIFEWYHQEALSSGSRIRKGLSDSVYSSMLILANGILSNPNNDEIVDRIKNESLSAQKFYSTILKLVYRLLFLLVIEERNLVFGENLSTDQIRKKKIYYDYYSIARLVKLAAKQIYVDKTKSDLWKSMLAGFRLFESESFGSKLGIKPLGFGIFVPSALNDIIDCDLDNESLLQVIKLFSYFTNEQGSIAKVNYADLNVEELGSVYEGLLALHPKFNSLAGSVSFSFADGNDRKDTASYYTNSDLVRELINSALVPVIHKKLAENKNSPENQTAVLLQIKVCDPAVGSGHMLLAAARTIAYYLAKVKTDSEPSPNDYRDALRQVIQHCVYGVDYNNEAVELCKLALWLEGYNTGKPLSFLDHKIKNGNSLVGVSDLEILKNGIPANAYNAVEGDDNVVARRRKNDNATFLRTQAATLDFSEEMEEAVAQMGHSMDEIENISQDTLSEVQLAKKKYEQLKSGSQWMKDWTACNLWTLPFFAHYTEQNERTIPTSQEISKYLKNAAAVDGRTIGMANGKSAQHKFFHWPLEFPEVFAQGGFDVMLGNPPWERIKLQEKEFFKNKDAEITDAVNANARKKLINKLPETNPQLYEEYFGALHFSECFSKFLHGSTLYPLTGRGDINLYSTFAELFTKKINNKGAAGFIVPTGIATDDGNKYFFADLVENDRLISLFDFENKKALFPDVHRSYKFSLLTVGDKKGKPTNFGFFLTDVNDLTDKQRIFSISKQDFININPNTKTTPIFRTKKDAELTAKLYSRIPILINENLEQNPWQIKFTSQFHMSNASHLFREEEQLLQQGYTLQGSRFVKGNEVMLPLYESKFIQHYDHRFGSFKGIDSRSSTQLPTPTEETYQNPEYVIKPWYWVNKEEIDRLTENKYFLGFRNNARTNDERTSIFSLLPSSGVGNSMPLMFSRLNSVFQSILIANNVCIPFDYVVRQKLGGVNMNFTYVNQYLYPSPKTFEKQDILKIVPLVAELAYTSWDIKSFADALWQDADDELREAITSQWEENRKETGGNTWEIPSWSSAYPEIEWEKDKGCPLPPFKWNEERRAILKAELDAYYAILYGLEREDLLYILDPQEAMGDDFPGETFRGMKDKEIRNLGEYRTKKLVLSAYDRLRKDWDMPNHILKLESIWQFHQIDLSSSKKLETKQKKKVAKTEKTPAKTAAKKTDYQPVELFEEPNLFNQPGEVSENCKVVIKNTKGQFSRLHITPGATKGLITEGFREILPDSKLAQLLHGKSVAETIAFGEEIYRVEEIL